MAIVKKVQSSNRLQGETTITHWSAQASQSLTRDSQEATVACSISKVESDSQKDKADVSPKLSIKVR